MLELMNKATKNEATKQRYETKELSLDEILPNPDNLYSVDDIDDLADSILLTGRVLQNIVVTAADETGKHMIISGHRRYLACQKLVADGHSQFSTITALIENETDKSLRELMLIYTNSTSRVLTDAEKMRQAQRATDILKNLKAEGKFDGRIRDAVARMLKTTSGQLARYAAIANNLTNETLKEAFDDGRLGVSAAYEASRLPEEKQQEVADKLDTAGEVSIRDVKGEDEPPKIKTNPEGIPMLERALEIPDRFRTKITIHIIKKDGKYYATSSGLYRTGGWGVFPDTRYSKPYDTEQEAIDAKIKEIAERGEEWHKLLWESGYLIVGEPEEIKEKKAQPATENEPIAPTKQNMSSSVAEEETEAPADEPLTEEIESEPLISQMEYAFETVKNELTALEESYRGAAERHIAMGGDYRGKENLAATAQLFTRLIVLVTKIEREEKENE